MKLGFTTLAMFTQPNSDIIETAKNMNLNDRNTWRRPFF